MELGNKKHEGTAIDIPDFVAISDSQSDQSVVPDFIPATWSEEKQTSQS